MTAYLLRRLTRLPGAPFAISPVGFALIHAEGRRCLEQAHGLAPS